jgi:hypothetical protein
MTSTIVWTIVTAWGGVRCSIGVLIWLSQWPFRPDDSNFAYVTIQQKADILLFGVSWGFVYWTNTYLTIKQALILLTNADLLPPSLRG